VEGLSVLTNFIEGIKHSIEKSVISIRYHLFVPLGIKMKQRVVTQFIEREVIIWRYFLLVPVSLKMKFRSFKVVKAIMRRLFFINTVSHLSLFLIYLSFKNIGHYQGIVLPVVILNSFLLSIVYFKIRYTVPVTARYMIAVIGLVFINGLSVVTYSSIYNVKMFEEGPGLAGVNDQSVAKYDMSFSVATLPDVIKSENYEMSGVDAGSQSLVKTTEIVFDNYTMTEETLDDALDPDLLTNVAFSLQGDTFAYPNPHYSGNTVQIGYTLTKEPEDSVFIHFYNKYGNEVRVLEFNPGENGAWVGYNTPEYDSEDFVGDYLSKGIYVYLIVYDNNVIGKNKMGIR
jgi:hypothetical protein